jgi:hypothetical protein
MLNFWDSFGDVLAIRANKATTTAAATRNGNA